MTLTKRHFSPLLPLWNLYDSLEPEFSFKATTKQEWREWHQGLRKKLTELLGGFPDERCDLEAEVVEEVEVDGIVREKVIFQSEPLVSVPAYLFIPSKISLPAPAVVAMHGHGTGVEEIAGIWRTEDEKQHILDYNTDYALQSAKEGFVAFAPEQRCFGERREAADIEKGRSNSSCRQASFNAMMMGKTVIGQRVWDVMRAIDYLETRPEVDAERIACIGLSGGGTATHFSAALEDRIKVAIISGYFNTFKDSIMAMWHCECNYIPHILKYAEMYDVAALIAPRPLLIESGTQDTIFPVKATEFALSKVQKVYELLGVPERLDKDIFEGPHKFSGTKAFDWLRRWL